MRCKKCGLEIDADTKFCPGCGTKNVLAPVPEAEAPAKTKCPSCGVEFDANAKFCPGCGAKNDPAAKTDAPTALKCPKCGNELNPGAKFCPVCGEKMGADAPAAAASAPAAPNAPTDPAADAAKCPQCGLQLNPGAKFCPGCGRKFGDVSSTDDTVALPNIQPINPTAPAASTYTPATPAYLTKPKAPIDKRVFIFGGIVIAVVAVIIIIVSIIANQPVKVTLDDYIKVEYKGCEGYGTVDAYFDSSKFENEWKDKLTYKSNPANYRYSYMIENDNPATLISYVVRNSLTGDDLKNLKNGDKIKINWEITESMKQTISEYINCELIYNEKEFTVTDLKALKDVDPFDYIKVEFSGKAPNGVVYVSNNSSDYYFSTDVDKKSGLSNGDKIKVTITTSEDDEKYYAEHYNIRLTQKEKEYTVSGLETLVTTIKDIPTAALNKMKSDSEDSIKANCVGSNKSFRSAEYLGTILITPKSSDSWNSTYYYTVYHVTASVTSSEKKTFDYEFYTYSRTNDLKLLEDGSFTPKDFTCTHTYNSIYPEKTYEYFYGYETYEKLYDDVVTANLSEYKYETDVDLSKVEKPEQSSEPEESSQEESSNPEESSTDESSGEESDTSDLPSLKEFFESETGKSTIESAEKTSSTDSIKLTVTLDGDSTVVYSYKYTSQIKNVEKVKERLDSALESQTSAFLSAASNFEKITSTKPITLKIVYINSDDTVITERDFSN